MLIRCSHSAPSNLCLMTNTRKTKEVNIIESPATATSQNNAVIRNKLSKRNERNVVNEISSCIDDAISMNICEKIVVDHTFNLYFSKLKTKDTNMLKNVTSEVFLRGFVSFITHYLMTSIIAFIHTHTRVDETINTLLQITHKIIQ
jgi:transcriptional regulator CtsR